MVILLVNIRVRPPPSWNSVFGTTWLRFSSRSRFRARARNLVGPGPVRNVDRNFPSSACSTVFYTCSIFEHLVHLQRDPQMQPNEFKRWGHCSITTHCLSLIMHCSNVFLFVKRSPTMGDSALLFAALLLKHPPANRALQDPHPCRALRSWLPDHRTRDIYPDTLMNRSLSLAITHELGSHSR